MFELAIDRDMFDHPGKQTTMAYAVRRYQDRPALTVGETVTIVRFHADSDRYGIKCRVLVRTESGAERWTPTSNINPVPDENLDPETIEGRASFYARLGEIAAERFAHSD